MLRPSDKSPLPVGGMPYPNTAMLSSSPFVTVCPPPAVRTSCTFPSSPFSAFHSSFPISIQTQAAGPVDFLPTDLPSPCAFVKFPWRASARSARLYPAAARSEAERYAPYRSIIKRMFVELVAESPPVYIMRYCHIPIAEFCKDDAEIKNERQRQQSQCSTTTGTRSDTAILGRMGDTNDKITSAQNKTAGTQDESSARCSARKAFRIAKEIFDASHTFGLGFSSEKWHCQRIHTVGGHDVTVIYIRVKLSDLPFDFFKFQRDWMSRKRDFVDVCRHIVVVYDYRFDDFAPWNVDSMRKIVHLCGVTQSILDAWLITNLQGRSLQIINLPPPSFCNMLDGKRLLSTTTTTTRKRDEDETRIHSPLGEGESNVASSLKVDVSTPRGIGICCGTEVTSTTSETKDAGDGPGQLPSRALGIPSYLPRNAAGGLTQSTSSSADNLLDEDDEHTMPQRTDFPVGGNIQRRSEPALGQHSVRRSKRQHGRRYAPQVTKVTSEQFAIPGTLGRREAVLHPIAAGAESVKEKENGKKENGKKENGKKENGKDTETPLGSSKGHLCSWKSLLACAASRSADEERRRSSGEVVLQAEQTLSLGIVPSAVPAVSAGRTDELDGGNKFDETAQEGVQPQRQVGKLDDKEEDSKERGKTVVTVKPMFTPSHIPEAVADIHRFPESQYRPPLFTFSPLITSSPLTHSSSDAYHPPYRPSQPPTFTNRHVYQYTSTGADQKTPVLYGAPATSIPHSAATAPHIYRNNDRTTHIHRHIAKTTSSMPPYTSEGEAFITTYNPMEDSELGSFGAVGVNRRFVQTAGSSLPRGAPIKQPYVMSQNASQMSQTVPYIPQAAGARRNPFFVLPQPGISVLPSSTPSQLSFPFSSLPQEWAATTRNASFMQHPNGMQLAAGASGNNVVSVAGNTLRPRTGAPYFVRTNSRHRTPTTTTKA